MQKDKAGASRELQLLKEKMISSGYRLTNQRIDIAKWALETHEHFSVDDLLFSFRKKGTKLSTATAYRVMQMLLELGFLIEHDFGKGQKFFEHIIGHPHHEHFICDNCGGVSEFSSGKIDEIKKDISKKYNFHITNHSLCFFGTCDKCKK
ncbi:MAG: transcriptional repressor [Spirochaetia bacterium]|nr:transcriptional repressor [Spirochaetia bacterium]